MKLPKALSIGLAAVQSVLAVDPTAAATPCVPSRTVDAAIQYVSSSKKKKNWE